MISLERVLERARAEISPSVEDVEQLFEPVALFASSAPVPRIALVILVVLIPRTRRLRGARGRRLGRVRMGRTACKTLSFLHMPLDNLVQFATIQPDPPTGWAVVDFDTRPRRYLQIGAAHRALHGDESVPHDTSRNRGGLPDARGSAPATLQRGNSTCPAAQPPRRAGTQWRTADCAHLASVAPNTDTQMASNKKVY